MDADQLRARQAPIKKRFRETPALAQQVLQASGILTPEATMCEVKTFLGSTPAGLHTYTGGDGTEACAAEMLLEALIGCAGVTFSVVAKVMEISFDSVVVRAEGHLDFRGTLGVERDSAVGYERIKLIFEIATEADENQLAKLVELTDRYCVVFQSLKSMEPSQFVKTDA